MTNMQTNMQRTQALLVMSPIPLLLGLGVWNYFSWQSEHGIWPPWAIVTNHPVYFVCELLGLSLVAAAGAVGPVAARDYFSRMDGGPRGGYAELLQKATDPLFVGHITVMLLLIHFAGYYEMGLALSANA